MKQGGAEPPQDTRCTVCREDYPQTGQHTGPSWLLWGKGFRVCKRCVQTARDARRAAERASGAGAAPPPVQGRCPFCSFDPTNLNDYCEKHRPAVSQGEPQV